MEVDEPKSDGRSPQKMEGIPAEVVGQVEVEDMKLLDKPAKKSPKKKPPKNAVGSALGITLSDLGASSLPSPCSSITSSTINPRVKPQQGPSRNVLPDAYPVKPKDKSLIYVNYLNSFANSLTLHPPIRRATKLPASVTVSRLPQEDELLPNSVAVGINRQSMDFEISSRSGQIIPYVPDLDRDRCLHADSFCPFSKREGYVYCEKHLLDDKALPFVPCAYQRTDSNPCPYPARMPPGAGGKNRPQRSKEALCSLHMEKCIQEVQSHMTSSANAILSTMDGLAGYNVNLDKGLPPTNVSDMLDDLAEPQTRDNLETYLRATAKDTYATDSESDNSVIDDKDLGLFTSRAFDTDNELDSEDEEPVKYGHYFTVEELTRMLRAKIAKQKELLAVELRLQEYKLKDARARYLTEVAEEKVILSSISTQALHDSESHKAYREVRTMLRVNRKRPKFSFLHTRKPCIKLRHGAKLPESVSRCLHGELGPNGKMTKCKQNSLPFSRHCLSHILEDMYQYLYKRCAAVVPKQCNNPVLKNMGVKYCYQHTDLNRIRAGPCVDDNSQTISSSSDGDAETEPSAPVLMPEPKTKKSARGSSQKKRASGKSKLAVPATNEDMVMFSQELPDTEIENAIVDMLMSDAP